MSSSAASSTPLLPPRSLRARWQTYRSVLSIGFQDTFVYRWNFLLRAVFSLAPLAGTVFIWRAMFDAREGKIEHYDFPSMVFYFLLTMLVENLVSPTEDEWRIAAEIRDGQISALLVKPMNYLAYRTSLFISYRMLYTAVTLPVVGALFMLFHEYVRLPASLATWPLFALSVAMAAALQFLIAYTLAMLAFWILEISTVVFIFYSFEYFLSGQVFPLDIMPEGMRAFIKFSPFTYELFFPVQVFTERVQGADLWTGFAIQAGWVLVAFAAARHLYRRGIDHYQAVGG